jgi:hypothetical protein
MAETLTPEEWERRCSEAGPRLARVLQRKAAALALRMQSRAVDNATTRLNKPTGNLRRSIAGRVIQTGRTVAAVEGVSSQLSLFGRTVQGSPLSVVLSAGGRVEGAENVIYARIQDQGGNVRPVNRQWLAIPDKSTKTPAGRPRFASPRDYPRPLWFHVIRGGSGKSALAVLLERVGGENVGRWWLRKEVDIPASYYARDAFRATQAQVPATLGDAVEVAFDVPGSVSGGAR